MNGENIRLHWVLGAILAAAILPAAAAAPLHLAGRTFDPQAESPSARRDSFSTDYWILQFDGPIQESWKQAAVAAGAELLDYVPEFAFIVRAPKKVREAVAACPHVSWFGPYLPNYRSAPYRTIKRTADEKGEYSVVFFPGLNPATCESLVTERGGKVLARTQNRWKTRLRARLSAAAAADLAGQEGVKWIEDAPSWEFTNNQARNLAGVEVPWTRSSFYGAGQVVAVADSGIDRGTNGIGYLHEDFLAGDGTSRVLRIVHRSSATSDKVGHGTHVAGSILGNGKLSGAVPASRSFPATCYAGIAPEASLVVQNLADLEGRISGLPDDLNVLFAQAFGGGANVHNNSWGSTFDPSYSSYSADVDEFSWDNPDFLIVFSAGNSGVDTTGDGRIDQGSVLAPATAKNCITVGASENNRPDGSSPSPAYDDAYGWYWPLYFPAYPISSDHVSNHPEGMAAFSSRGSSFSGRYKPEIVAPGTNIISTRSHAIDLASNVLWGPGGLSSTLREWYTFSGGTSMSTPLVSGAAALVRQFYADNFGASPSSALIKATLLSWARDITPGQYGSGSEREIPASPRPNNVEGWGRLDFASCLPLAELEDFYYFQVDSGIATGGVDTYQVEAESSLKDICFTLAWTDYPGSAPTSGGLVNDLDLEVVDPRGTTHHPNRAIAVEGLAYDNWDIPDDYVITGELAFPGVVGAVRFTPSTYPATLKSGSFLVGSIENLVYPVRGRFLVYSGDASGPKNVLWSSEREIKWGASWYQVDFSNLDLSISSGDFYLGVSPVDEEFSWGVDDNALDVSNRTWQYVPGSGWIKLNVHDALIRANVSYATTRDRTNNVETVDISLPAPGTYQVKVKGYNVPHGPQPYALVVTRPEWSGEDFPDPLVLAGGDYDGDGTADPAWFRTANGRWSIRGLSSFYFGRLGDIPACGDYDGDGTDEVAFFRPAQGGLWKVRGTTNFYFGQAGMVPVPADYDGDGDVEPALFREKDGFWKIRGLTQFYFGREGDQPVPGDYEGSPSGATRAAVFRPASKYWAIRNLTYFYFGKEADTAVPRDYDGIPGIDLAWFRPATGLWAMFGYTRFYFGDGDSAPVCADYDGDGTTEYAFFQKSTGLWKVRGLTRFYFGKSGDLPVTR